MPDSKTFKDEKEFEDALVNLLQEYGWKDGVLYEPTEEDLYKNWSDIIFKNSANKSIDRLNNYPLSEGEIEQLKEKCAHQSPFSQNKVLCGKTITIRRDDDSPDIAHRGKDIGLDIFDSRRIADGAYYQIARQPKLKGADPIMPNRRGDIMLLINGIPVVHIELKNNKSKISEAYNQIEKYSKEKVLEGIFSFIQIFVAMTPDDVLYFANPGSEGKFNSDFYFHWTDKNNEIIYDWQKFTREFLPIIMVHQMVGFYTVSDTRDNTLKVLRPYQFNAVDAIVTKVEKYKWDGSIEGGRAGFVWQTTGSGKTLTSFKAADVISKRQAADKIVFLVDRTELDVQSYEHYVGFADSESDVQKTRSTRELITKLKSNNPSDDLIVTSIQKASNIYDDDSSKRMAHDIEMINKKHIVFIVDECHRDTFGLMMSKIKETFTSAIFFGFSGTPIQIENQKKGSTSATIFGDELPGTRYSIAMGIRDGNVLAFYPQPIKIFEDEQMKQEVARIKAETEGKDYFSVLSSLEMAGFLNEDGTYVKGAEDYMEERNEYEKKRFKEHVVLSIQKNFPEKSRDFKFHAIFATSSIKDAIEYYRIFKEKAPEIYTTVLVDKNDDNKSTNYEKIQGLKEIISDYNERYASDLARPFDLNTYPDMKRDVANRLSHDKKYKNMKPKANNRLDILIVVNQMLTGFDSKYVNTLYLDKILREENVIQAFSRTNRKLDQTKPFGQIYYFRKVHTMQKNIDKAIELYSGENKTMVYVDQLEGNLKKFNSAFEEIKSLFEAENIDDFSELPESKPARAKFSHLFIKFNSIYESIRVQGFTWKKQPPLYGRTFVEPTKDDFDALCQRYADLYNLRDKNGVDDSSDDEGYLLDARVASPEEGRKYDYEYMNEKFKQFVDLSLNNGKEEDREKLKMDLNKQIAKLPEEEQKYARIIFSEVENGIFVFEESKNIHDYINEYMKDARDTVLAECADTFGLNYNLLDEIMKLPYALIDEHGRFDKLKKSADMDKVKAYFKQKDPSMSTFSINAKFDELLRSFIRQQGFDL